MQLCTNQLVSFLKERLRNLIAAIATQKSPANYNFMFGHLKIGLITISGHASTLNFDIFEYLKLV